MILRVFSILNDLKEGQKEGWKDGRTERRKEIRKERKRTREKKRRKKGKGGEREREKERKRKRREARRKLPLFFATLNLKHHAGSSILASLHKDCKVQLAHNSTNKDHDLPIKIRAATDP